MAVLLVLIVLIALAIGAFFIVQSRRRTGGVIAAREPRTPRS
jgi:uncharacterized protein (UPF0333 family)